MALEAEILVTNYGIPIDFAQNLLIFTKNDIEAAIKIIESADKDIIVLKSKFISSKKMNYGAFVYFYNTQTNLPEYIFAVVSSDINLSRIKIESGWKDLLEELINYIDNENSLPQYFSKLESQIMSDEITSNLSNCFTDKSKIDLANIKRTMLNEISNIFMDTAIILKLVQEETEIFKFKLYSGNIKYGYKHPSSIDDNEIILLNLKIEPVLAPLGGIDIENIRVNDEILAKIIDTREIVQFVLSFANHEYEDSLYGRVVFIQKSQGTNNIIVFLEFGTGILGKFVIGGRIRVQAKEKKKSR